MRGRLLSRPLARAYTTVFSGVQPSGQLHLGNYFGACQFFLRSQEHPFVEGRPIERQLFSIVDWHSMTVPGRTGLRDAVIQSAAMLLASGIDPSRTILFRQSDVLEHCALMWILMCRVSTARLSRMTQWQVGASREYLF